MHICTAAERCLPLCVSCARGKAAAFLLPSQSIAALWAVRLALRSDVHAILLVRAQGKGCPTHLVTLDLCLGMFALKRAHSPFVFWQLWLQLVNETPVNDFLSDRLCLFATV